ncbi:UDP-N-acetylmuramoyl-L-alanine--D-glutamate ligase [Comamonas sp.]|uniref:UDP-N-acetylmuramoyl-L-alanine--D-glutamate ligase n=1 Tax=Comamonas sp. TaxID=34028 RepID=UPI002899C1A3|nr:UDP-N-acetylmuramoyl-L-alanine--D-glutamate ligase [Comamonas sp.]
MSTEHLHPLDPSAEAAAAPLTPAVAPVSAAGVAQPDGLQPEAAAPGADAPPPAPPLPADGVPVEAAADESAAVATDAADAAAAPAAEAPAADMAPVPDVSTLTAAKDAAAFVAQIFADPGVSDAASSEVTAVDIQPQEAEVVYAPVPAQWPQGQEHALQGQHVLVLGLGTSGLAMARWCARCGAQVTVADTREAPPQLAQLRSELPDVRFVAGALTAALVDGQPVRVVYRSPGLSPETVAPVVDAARAIGLPVSGELDLFSLALQSLAQAHGYVPKVLAITGTNGKTTVTSLTGQLLAHAGMSTAVAGNIGPSLLDTLSQHIDAQSLPQAWVLELSSFQLEDAHAFNPTAATVLNLSQDHLDWHGSMAAYAGAKAKIFGSDALMVLNRDDPAVMAMLPPPVRIKLQRPQLRPHISFGLDLPIQPGDYGLEVVNGMAWLVRAQDDGNSASNKRNQTAADDVFLQRLMPADALRIRGRHNAMNALAALALGHAAGAGFAPMLFGLREYRGERHRVEPIGIVSDVEYFDDSKGTNVGATVAALMGLGAERRIVLILGGEGKGQDFSPLAAPVLRYARAVVLIGRDAPLIEAALADTGVPLLHAPSMDEAVLLASQKAVAGDAVLMSPACASFDMFQNYGHRAEVFCQAVAALAEERGTSLEVQP